MNDHSPVENDEDRGQLRPMSHNQRRRKGVNVLRFLLPGRLRGVSGILFALLGVAGLAAVIILLVALIVFLVKRSSETADFLPTATSTPFYAEQGPTATLAPSPVQITAVVSPTMVLANETPSPPATEQRTPDRWMKVSDTGALGLRSRSGPGLNYETTGVFDEGAELRVIDGPQEADGIVWWKLESESGVTGWAAGNFLKPIEQTDRREGDR